MTPTTSTRHAPASPDAINYVPGYVEPAPPAQPTTEPAAAVFQDYLAKLQNDVAALRSSEALATRESARAVAALRAREAADSLPRDRFEFRRGAIFEGQAHGNVSLQLAGFGPLQVRRSAVAFVLKAHRVPFATSMLGDSAVDIYAGEEVLQIGSLGGDVFAITTPEERAGFTAWLNGTAEEGL